MKKTLLPLRRHEGTTEEMSDEALMAAAGTGAAAAIGALFDRHHQQVYRFLCHLALVDVGEVEDLVQATFADLPKLAKKFRGGSQVSTFILGIAKNKARTYRRSASRRLRLKDAAYEEHRDAPPTALELVTQKEDAVYVAKAVAALTLKLREATVLVYLEGLSGREAAKALGIREGTLWKRLHTARQALRSAHGTEKL